MAAYRLLIFLLICLLPIAALGQNLTIELGDNEIGLNQSFTIVIAANGEAIKEYSKFPDIQGFKKAGRSSSTTTTTVEGGTVEGGQIALTQRLTQKYKPTSEGIFKLRPFSMRINDKSVDSKGTTITVGPAVTETQTMPHDPEDLTDLDEEEEDTEATTAIPDLKSVEGGAFLNLHASKNSVFTGEGLHITLFFYLPFHERNLLEFYKFGKQLPELVKQIRQPNVWEEFFEQYEIEPENLQIEGKPYLRFKLYEAMYFPLTSGRLQFPQLSLEMTHYRMISQRSFGGAARVAELKTYSSVPFDVEIKSLPPHPLRDQVAVGKFRLRESVSQKKINTGKGFHYLFQVVGTGNISSLTAPQILWPAGLSAYEPVMKQNLRKANARISGLKAFDFYITPGEPGQYDFGKFAYWVYFDPLSAKYDTLKSAIKINVKGPSSRNLAIAQAPRDSYYDAIDKASNKLLLRENIDQIKLYANIVLALLLLVVLYIYFKK